MTMARAHRDVSPITQEPGRRSEGPADYIEIIDSSSDDELNRPPVRKTRIPSRSLKYTNVTHIIEVDDNNLAPVAGPSRQDLSVIDLTISDDEDDRPNQQGNLKTDVIDISTDEDEPAVVLRSNSKGKKCLGPRLSFKAVLDEMYEDEQTRLDTNDEINESSSIAPGDEIQETLLDRTNLPDTSKDEELARQLASQERSEQASTSVQPPVKINKKQQRADEALARRLAKQEEKEYLKFVKAVDQKTEGIVFNVAIDATMNTLEDGTPAHPDDLDRFEPWRKKFEETSGGQKVKKFHWFVNYELEKRFEAARETLRTLCGKEPDELMMFHGTAPQNVDLILKDGLKIGGQKGHRVINGTAMGYGIYLAEQAMTSIGYSQGGNRMFACRVIPGRTTNNARYSKTVPKDPVGSGTFESYASPSSGVYVVRHTDLVLPCYMIEWGQPQMGIFGSGMAPQGQIDLPAMPQFGMFGMLSQLAPIVPNLPVQMPQPWPPLNIPNVIPAVPQVVAPKTPRKRQKASTEALHRHHARSRPSKAKKTQ